MIVMRTYLIRFYNADEGKIDETDFCSASFLGVRLVFVEWALSEFDILPTILSVTCTYNQEDALTQLVKQDYYPPSNAYETYGHIEKRIEFEDAESSQELLERAKKYLRQSQFDETSMIAMTGRITCTIIHWRVTNSPI